MIVTKHSRGRNRTRTPTESRAHHGIAGGSLGSILAGWSGTSFISVISSGLMTILSIGLRNVVGHCSFVSFVESGASVRVLGFILTNPKLTRYIQVQFAKRKGATVLRFVMISSRWQRLSVRQFSGHWTLSFV